MFNKKTLMIAVVLVACLAIGMYEVHACCTPIIR